METGFLFRKKSGEIVKPALRNSSRTSSPPSPKSVHFHEDLEDVRHFFSIDQPISINSDNPPIDAGSNNSKNDTEVTISSQNSSERQSFVQFECLWLSKDRQSLIGTVIVTNVVFEKYVAVHFTFDNWQTISEVAAEYNHGQMNQLNRGFDQFRFIIQLQDQLSIWSKTLVLCIWYYVKGQVYWDNNSGENFHINFV
jgi:hypothetical protein